MSLPAPEWPCAVRVMGLFEIRSMIEAVLPRANVHSRLWDLDAVILQSVEGKLRSNQRDVRNSTAYTMAVIFNTICEAHSDVLVDPYLNGASDPPEPR